MVIASNNEMDNFWEVITKYRGTLKNLAEKGEETYNIDSDSGEPVGRIPEEVKYLERKGYLKESEEELQGIEDFHHRKYSLTEEAYALLEVNPNQDRSKFLQSLDNDFEILSRIEAADGINYDVNSPNIVDVWAEQYDVRVPEEVENLRKRGFLRRYKTGDIDVKEFRLTDKGREMLEIS